ncbi:MAG: uracil-DNA glycosylase [Chlamydiae bacterium]|nr:uracil-DNA glycosylase [Chlamydiota bacterium]
MRLENSWNEVLKEELNLPFFKDLQTFLEEEKRHFHIYPPEDLIFNAFTHTPYDKVKVVIVGQDPYHGPGQAHGLAFSVLPGVKIPPSLKNIYKELIEDVKILPPKMGSLTSWADQGVLLLNATLTVRDGEPKSHYGRGWERFTDKVIEKLADRKDPLVFLLWGKSAQEKVERVLVTGDPGHLILIAAHPSPFSAKNFLGCKHFSKTNEQLIAWGKSPINWQVP